jgi:uncharacterized membrane protein
MSDNQASPPPPPTSPPPQGPPPPSPPAAGGASSNRNLMIALAYLWILAVVPLVVEKEDQEVQWHAKHGLVLFGVEIILYIVFGMILSVIPFVGCISLPIVMLVGVAFLVIRILCIVKGINGERFLVPGISDLVQKF